MYEIGTKVQFSHTVGRKKVASGSTLPIRVPNYDQGTVVGMTRVYDAEMGGPGSVPVLAHPKNVYIVAITLWTRVKVFEEDMSDITPQGLAPVTGRKDPTDTDLDTWVVDALNQYVGTKTEFTAYDVTKLVRGDHPDYDIQHAVVRGLVHAYMQPVMANGDYVTENRDEGTYTAIVFVPGA